MKQNLLAGVFTAALLSALLWACTHEDHLFQLIPAEQSGIDFDNRIVETDSLNILDREFIYNGGGIGVGDFNGDGLQDLYFTGSQVENRLYLNKGNLRFDDVTETAGVRKYPGQWSAGVNVLDINLDGKPDLYVCNTFINDPEKRRNLLFVNQGNNAAGIPQFDEMAAEYGIADTTHSSHAQFFDYDNDGDLDLFIGVNIMDSKSPNRYIKKITDGSALNRDRLYRNDPDNELGHPVFTDVSQEAGIKLAGFSHSTLISDFNDDGWPDIYVANDYVSNDLLYINNRNGTFTNEIDRIFKHQAASAMGSDVADINNDGRLDVFTTEMMPYYNKRKKLFLGPNNYSTYANNREYGYEFQYMRNVLQLNRGRNPETGLPVFSDVGLIGNVQETEWSWAPLLADYDNDGFRDLFVTNGFPRDVTDHDFGAYRSTVSHLMTPMQLQDMIPQVKVPKFVFKNDGQLRFADCSALWGVDKPAFSNGAVYADLDNDGDLDLVVNNIDDPAFLFKNTLNDQTPKSNYLRLHVEGPPGNPDAFGVLVTAFFNGQAQAAEITSGRGYLSASERTVHFGLGTVARVDSVLIRWGPRGISRLYHPQINRVVTVRYADLPPAPEVATTIPGLFDELNPATLGLGYTNRDTDFVDFNFQVTLPHKFTQYGPGLSVGDVNADGLDDVFIGGSTLFDAVWLIQDQQGKFTRREAGLKTDPDKREEDLGTLLFDADADGDLDLYIVRGSPQQKSGSPLYQDVLCVNDGAGHFAIAPDALPNEAACGQSVKAADFDADGDLDLFVGGRVLPFTYPKSDRSFLLRNDSKEKNKPFFTDVTEQCCPGLAFAGLVSDALWTDFNNDNKPDLILAGEWMPLRFFRNEGNRLTEVTDQTGIAGQTGWWTSLAAADFDNDGDIDYAAGNFGENIYFKCSGTEPLTIYAKDFDGNGAYDPFISCYWQDSLGKRREYFYHTRDDLIRQLIQIRRKFNTYGQLGEATVQDIFSAEELKGAQIMKANRMSSSYVENLGNGKFALHVLPVQAQLAPIYGMLPYDADRDGRTDLLLVGNDYGMELLQGRADAFYGLLLRNTGPGAFEAVELDQSRFFVPGDARALTRLGLADGREIVLAAQNQGALKVFTDRLPAGELVVPAPSEVRARISRKDGRKQLREFYWGSSFLSQEPRSFRLDKSMTEVALYDRNNKLTRTITVR